MNWLHRERRVVIAFALGAVVAFVATYAAMKLCATNTDQLLTKPPSWEARQNMNRSKLWLSNNARREGIIQLPNGVQYKVLKVGAGNKVRAKDSLVARYVEAPLTEAGEITGEARKLHLAVDKVLPGLRSVLLLMREGSEVEIFMPPDMAYATSGRPGFPPGLAISYRLSILKIMEP